jgi:hypothetical protein
MSRPFQTLNPSQSQGDARTARARVKPAHFPRTLKTGWQWFWHPFWVQGLGCVCPVVGPLRPGRPPATGYQPCRVGFRKQDRNPYRSHGSQELDAPLLLAQELDQLEQSRLDACGARLAVPCRFQPGTKTEFVGLLRKSVLRRGLGRRRGGWEQK